MITNAKFISRDIFLKEAWGKTHPLAISRHKKLMEILNSFKWLGKENLISSIVASKEIITRFHDKDYVDFLENLQKNPQISAENRQKYNIGTMENPIFDGLFERAAATIGGSIKAAQTALQGETVFFPAGGTHHGKRNKASGFCYFNDPVFSIYTLLDAGLKNILYIDIDAHHGDGVEIAFKNDARIKLISTYEKGRFPEAPQEITQLGNSLNIPFERNINDSEFELIMGAVIKLAQKIKPQALVIVAGADCLKGDPLSSMNLSNLSFTQSVKKLCEICNINVVLGGGGYNPWTMVRAWAALWAVLAGFEIPTHFNEEQKLLLREYECDLVEEIEPIWLETLLDLKNQGDIRPYFEALAEKIKQTGF